MSKITPWSIDRDGNRNNQSQIMMRTALWTKRNSSENNRSKNKNSKGKKLMSFIYSNKNKKGKNTKRNQKRDKEWKKKKEKNNNKLSNN